MKTLKFFFIILFTPLVVFSQSGWVALNTGEIFPLLSIQATDSQNVYACGLNGTIIKSTNGGSVWTGKAGGTDYGNYSLSFVNTNTGYMINYSDTIGSFLYNTTDAGASWKLIYQDSNQRFVSVFFISVSTGWIGVDVGNILYTTNGGSNWTQQIINSIVFSLFFVNNQTGWASCYPYSIYKTTNSGINWISQPLPSGSGALHSIYFINSQTGYCVGQNGIILCTTNSGTNWVRQNSGTVFDFNSVYFVNASTGWVVGEFGFVLYTTNGGAAWLRKTGFPKFSYQSVYFLNPNTGFICGEFGTIYKTTTGGF